MSARVCARVRVCARLCARVRVRVCACQHLWSGGSLCAKRLVHTVCQRDLLVNSVHCDLINLCWRVFCVVTCAPLLYVHACVQ